MRHYRSIFEPTGQWNKDHDIKQGDESDLISVNILLNKMPIMIKIRTTDQVHFSTQTTTQTDMTPPKNH
uniref:Uncharacterized protein n=1 Tax=Romanomermis culicivorax TaxID=13658 RepID=A0A915K3T0_ROMCU